MAKEYRSQRDFYYEQKIESLLNLYPEYLADFATYIESNTEPSTRYGYISDITLFLRYIVYIKGIDGVTDLSELNLSHLEQIPPSDYMEYMSFLRHHYENGQVVSCDKTTINRRMVSLRKFFSVMFNADRISSCQIEKVTLPSIKKGEKPVVYLKENESKQLINAVTSQGGLTEQAAKYNQKQSVRDLAIIYLLLSSAIRVSELVGLDFEDIDMSESCLHIIRKGGRYDTAYFSDECAGYLQEYLEERKVKKTRPQDEKAVFLSSQNKRISVRSVEVIIKKYKERAGIDKHITPHKLRSTSATDTYAAVGDVLAIKEKLGHANIETSMVYIGGAEERKKANRNLVSYNDDPI